jgi:hypothetical protein
VSNGNGGGEVTEDTLIVCIVFLAAPDFRSFVILFIYDTFCFKSLSVFFLFNIDLLSFILSRILLFSFFLVKAHSFFLYILNYFIPVSLYFLPLLLSFCLISFYLFLFFSLFTLSTVSFSVINIIFRNGNNYRML